MSKQDKLYEIFEQINECLRNEEFSHQDIIEQFKEFIDETLILKVEMELSDSDINKLENASIALGKAYEVKV